MPLDDIPQLDEVDDVLDGLASPTSLEVYEAILPHDNDMVAAAIGRRALDGAGGGDVDTHIADATAAHAASAISFAPDGSISATNVQAALAEVRDEAAGGGAPSTADFLVGTANGGLSNEIVVGATPGGELGGTWASPTVDATHSGSTHAAVQSAAEATAQAALDAHTTDTADAHDASAVSVDSATLVGTGTDVQAVLEELDNGIADHLADSSAAHTASAIAIVDAGSDFTATDVEGALDELQADNEAHVAAADPHAGYVLESLFDANTVLKADSDNTPAALTMGASTILARLAAGSIVAATPAELRTLLDVPTTGEAVLDALFDANTVLAATSDNTPAAVTMGASTILARLAAGNIVAATTAEIAALLASLLPGYQFDRVQKTTDSTSTATTAATATTFLTGASVTYDGVTAVRIIVNARDFFNSAAATTAVSIWRGSTDLGIVAATGIAANTVVPLYGEIQDTPPAGAHVYTARLWVTSASTGTVRGGAGGAGATVPHVMRVVKV